MMPILSTGLFVKPRLTPLSRKMHARIVPRAYVSPDLIYGHLQELNKRDIAILFEDKKKELRDLFGESVASEVQSTSLADDLVFLHTYYLSKKGDKTLTQIKDLRRYVMAMYDLENPMPPRVHDLIIDILRECKAL
jgi:hypothetical protein